MVTEFTLSRDEAEALYDAAISVMQHTTMRAHLWEAAVTLRMDCGMHACSSTPHEDAMDAVNKAIY